MDEEKRPAAEEGEQKPERELSGQYLWRVLKPAGCILVLLLFVVFMIFCFTWRGTPPEAAATEPPAATATVGNQ